MRRTTIAAVALTAGLVLAGCSTSSSEGPAKSPSAATSSAPVKQSRTEQLAACTDAIVAGEDSSAPECADLSSDDYLKALQAANKQGRDALESAIASASAAR
jgi:hypothetical protein